MFKCAETFITPNNFNLASYDMHFVESMDQSLANLAMLEQSFGTICTKIEEKTAKQRAKIAELKERITKCNETITGFQDRKQALAFTSPSKYVRSYKFEPENNVSMFNEYLIRPSIKRFDMNTRYDMEHNLEKIGKESKIALGEINQMVDLLYNKFKPKSKSSFEGAHSVSRKKKEGLGSIPSDIKYIDSLLVFNSVVNPYRHYQIIENNKVKKTQKVKIADLIEAIVLDKAPDNLNERIDRNDPSNLNYVPQDKEISDDSFEDQLELDGIVDFGEEFDDDAFNPSKPGVKKLNKTVAEPTSKPKEEKPKETKPPPPPKEPKPHNKPAKATPTPKATATKDNSGLPPPPPPPSGLPPPPPPPSGLPPPPPPPKGGLPPPPPPPKGLPPPPPPPSGSGPPPPPSGLPPPPPPPGGSAPPKPPSGGGAANVFAQLTGMGNPMARLKKTVTKESTPLGPPKNAPPVDPAPGAGGDNLPPRPLSHMQMLQQQIARRFKALNPVVKVYGQEADEDGPV